MKSLSLAKPHLIIMVGIPGSGKSFFAQNFAKTFNTPLVRYDTIRRELFNQPTMSSDENAIITRMGERMLDELFKTKSTIIFEGNSLARVDRQVLAKKAIDAGYEPLFVWVQTESHAAKLRSTKPTKDTDRYLLSPEFYDTILQRFSPPHVSEKAIVISGKHTYPSQLKIVLSHLVRARTVTESPPIPPRPPEHRNILIR